MNALFDDGFIQSFRISFSLVSHVHKNKDLWNNYVAHSLRMNLEFSQSFFAFEWWIASVKQNKNNVITQVFLSY